MEVLESRKQIVQREKKNAFITRCVFFVSIIVVMFLSIIIFNLEPVKKYELKLVGEKKEYLSINTNYIDKGFVLTVDNKKIDEKDIIYEVEDNIDSNLLGDYEVKYKIRYKGKNYVLKREVSVIDDIKPVISGIDDEIEIFYCKKDEVLNLNYVAEDNYDGIITDKVTLKREDDLVTLSVKDSSGNVATKNIKIKVSAESVPNITLNGNDLVYIKQGGTYTEKGAQATDGCGTKINNENIKITSNVDTSKVGNYEVTYKVTTKTNLTATKKRKVVVYDENSSKINGTFKDKVVYLTFDDGPGQYTSKLLDILKKYNVKATFFVTNQFKGYVSLIEREYNEGHSVAVHTLTHKWSVYKSVETYVKDFNDMNDIIYKYTNKRATIFRFPGGSSNTISRNYATGVVKAISNKMTKNGYVYFDWNVDSGDAAGANTNKIIKNVTNGIKNHDFSVVLMHDIKKTTLNAIEDIINFGLANGFTFETLNEDSPTVHHHINN